MWTDIQHALQTAGMNVSTPLSAREHCLKIISEFRKTDHQHQ